MIAQDQVSSPFAIGEKGNRRQIVQLQWLRGLAATLVMLYHTAAYQHLMRHDDTLLSWFGPGFGAMGVALFFAISGYLMSGLVRTQPPVIFLAHRVIRIYPIYFIATAIFYAADSASGHVSAYNSQSLLLMPLPHLLPYLRIEWTLIFEIAFYVCLFAIAAGRQANRIAWIALAWLAVMVATSLIRPDQGSRLLMPLYEILIVSTSVPMALGLLVPYAQRWGLPFALPLAAALLSLCLAIHHIENYDASRWLFGICAAFLVWGMAGIPAQSPLLRLGWLGRGFARLGDYSYGLYLCHVPIIMLVYREISSASRWSAWATAASAACLFAWALGAFDMRLYAWMKARLRLARPARLRVFIVSYALLYAIVSGVGAVQYHVHDHLAWQGHNLAVEIQLAGPVVDAASADSAAAKAGFHKAPSIAGTLEGVDWKREYRRLFVDMWAVDIERPDDTLFVSLFRNGQLLGVVMPVFARDDVTAALKLQRRVKTGLHFEQPEEACDPQPVVAVAFNTRHEYQVLASNAVMPVCASAGQGAP